MSFRVIIEAEAEREFAEAVAFYDEREPGDGSAARCRLPIACRRIEVVRKPPLQRPADLRAIVPERAHGAIHVLGEEARRQRLRLADDTPLDGAKDPFRAAGHEECRARRRARGPGRISLHLCLDVDGAPRGRLQPLDLVHEAGACRYDFLPSGFRARTHSMVSFVVSIVVPGQ